MSFDNKSAHALPTIVEAHDRFGQRSGAKPLDVDAEIATAFRSLTQLELPSSFADSRPDPERATYLDSPAPNYLEALDMISSAAELLTAMESHSQKVQAKAYEITQRAQLDIRVANEQVAALQRALSEKEAQIADLNKRVTTAEDRAQTAQQWLRRFQDTVTKAFPAHKLGDFRLLLDPVRPAA